MADIGRAFFLWLPGGTLLPFIVSRLTGADTRMALIEAGIFALGGLLVYPTFLGLVTARFVNWGSAAAWIELLFLAGFFLAALTILAMRRATQRIQRRAALPNRMRPR